MAVREAIFSTPYVIRERVNHQAALRFLLEAGYADWWLDDAPLTDCPRCEGTGEGPCVADTDDDGNCAACVRNPHAPCRACTRCGGDGCWPIVDRGYYRATIEEFRHRYYVRSLTNPYDADLTGNFGIDTWWPIDTLDDITELPDHVAETATPYIETMWDD